MKEVEEKHRGHSLCRDLRWSHVGLRRSREFSMAGAENLAREAWERELELMCLENPRVRMLTFSVA